MLIFKVSCILFLFWNLCFRFCVILLTNKRKTNRCKTHGDNNLSVALTTLYSLRRRNELERTKTKPGTSVSDFTAKGQSERVEMDGGMRRMDGEGGEVRR